MKILAKLALAALISASFLTGGALAANARVLAFLATLAEFAVATCAGGVDLLAFVKILGVCQGPA